MSRETATPIIPIIYIAGRFRGATPFDVHLHVVEAEKAGYRVACAGGFPFMPQANTAHFDKTLTDEFWLQGTLAMLARCDALFTVNNWRSSQGAQAEIAYARDRDIPVFFEDQYQQLYDWIEAWKANRSASRS